MATYTLMLDSDAGSTCLSAARCVVPVSRTVAGAKAVQRRRARVAAVRRPASGVLASSSRTAAVVTAGRNDRIAELEFRMGRWARLVTTLALVAAAIVVTVSVLHTGAAESISDVTVQSGDSLWSIAQQAEPAADPRTVIDQIKQMNSLDGDAVMVGAVLRVPTISR